MKVTDSVYESWDAGGVQGPLEIILLPMMTHDEFKERCLNAALDEPGLMFWDLSFEIRDFGREWIVRASAKDKQAIELKVPSASVTTASPAEAVHALAVAVQGA